MTIRVLFLLLLCSFSYAGNFNDNGATVGNDDLVGSARITKQGEFQILLVNETGFTSRRGDILRASMGYDFGVTTNIISGVTPIGVMASTGIANGGLVWVTWGGKAQFRIEDGQASTRSYWIDNSDSVNGRAVTTAAEPTQPTFSTTEHDGEVGHCIETVASGVDKLFWGMIHFR